jgi:hypothetical protein
MAADRTRESSMKTLVVAGFSAAALLAGAPALPHHSGAMFDRAKTVSVSGTVKQYLYTNPHSWVTVVADGEDGAQVSWDVEAFTPGAMQRWGIVPSTLKAGDKISLRLHPLRDGRRGGSLIDITLANGHYVNTTPVATPVAAPPA